MLMESILQNVEASFNNSKGIELELHVLVKPAFVTFSNIM